MMKVTALYTPPTDPTAFDEHYAAVHVPLARSMPGLVRFESSRAVGTADGSPAPFHRTADLYFEDMAAVQAGFASEQGVQTGKDAASLAGRTGSTLTIMISEVD